MGCATTEMSNRLDIALGPAVKMKRVGYVSSNLTIYANVSVAQLDQSNRFLICGSWVRIPAGVQKINAGLSQYIGDCSCSVQVGLTSSESIQLETMYMSKGQIWVGSIPPKAQSSLNLSYFR